VTNRTHQQPYPLPILLDFNLQSGVKDTGLSEEQILNADCSSVKQCGIDKHDEWNELNYQSQFYRRLFVGGRY
jgi:hypothetical protein